jgi:hypothetical protein
MFEFVIEFDLVPVLINTDMCHLLLRIVMLGFSSGASQARRNLHDDMNTGTQLHLHALHCTELHSLRERECTGNFTANATLTFPTSRAETRPTDQEQLATCWGAAALAPLYVTIHNSYKHTSNT